MSVKFDAVIDARHLRPVGGFYLALTTSWSDGTADPAEVPEGFFNSVEEALACLRDGAEEFGMEGVVYRCVPVRTLKVHRRVEVVTLATPPRRVAKKKRRSR